MNNKRVPIVFAMLAVFAILAFVGQYVIAPRLSRADQSAPAQGGGVLAFSEVMSKNLSAAMDPEGRFCALSRMPAAAR